MELPLLPCPAAPAKGPFTIPHVVKKCLQNDDEAKAAEKSPKVHSLPGPSGALGTPPPVHAQLSFLVTAALGSCAAPCASGLLPAAVASLRRRRRGGSTVPTSRMPTMRTCPMKFIDLHTCHVSLHVNTCQRECMRRVLWGAGNRYKASVQERRQGPAWPRAHRSDNPCTPPGPELLGRQAPRDSGPKDTPPPRAQFRSCLPPYQEGHGRVVEDEGREHHLQHAPGQEFLDPGRPALLIPAWALCVCSRSFECMEGSWPRCSDRGVDPVRGSRPRWMACLAVPPLHAPLPTPACMHGGVCL